MFRLYPRVNNHGQSVYLVSEVTAISLLSFEIFPTIDVSYMLWIPSSLLRLLNLLHESDHLQL